MVRLLVQLLPALALAALGTSSTSAQGADGIGPIYAPPVNLKSADEAKAHTHLPPLPEDVTELRFRDIYRMPVGARGLEFNATTEALAGKRVRVLGFMVREDKPVPGRLLLSPLPVVLFTREYGMADDLPPTLVHAWVTVDEDRHVPFTPGLLLLTGVLELGNLTELDGRVSFIRLRLDPPPAPASQAGLAAH